MQKKTTQRKIEGLRDVACTNLWAGIRAGLDLFAKSSQVENVQGLYILTDGMPNHMCPKQGWVARRPCKPLTDNNDDRYVNKLGPMLEQAAKKRPVIPTIHTFGFGYDIRSDLMQSIAEVGKGNYAFIPDAGMIGTAFIHAVANLYTTFGTSATIEIEVSDNNLPESSVGIPLKKAKQGRLLELGNIQYGQARDLVFECPREMQTSAQIKAILSYRTPNGEGHVSKATTMIAAPSTLPTDKIFYHLQRASICQLLASLFPLQTNNEHAAIKDTNELDRAQNQGTLIAEALRSSPYATNPEVKSLLDDLVGADPVGQISKALTSTHTQRYWQKWGRHYLPSLLHAHQRQMCNTFKDPGPSQYGKDSALFVKCRDELDAAFETLPAPKPSRPPKVDYIYNARGQVTGSITRPHRKVSMATYNSNSAPCFAGECLVKMGNGERQSIETLRPGMKVWTAAGERAIISVLRTDATDEPLKLCRLGDLLVTPWHPIQHRERWIFPINLAEPTVSTSNNRVFSLLLAPDTNPEAHTIEIGGMVCVTLGHGLSVPDSTTVDARVHPFFGDYLRVSMAAMRLPLDENKHLRCGGMLRHSKTDLVCGFVAATDYEHPTGALCPGTQLPAEKRQLQVQAIAAAC
jgi:hypothetical protein